MVEPRIKANSLERHLYRATFETHINPAWIERACSQSSRERGSYRGSRKKHANVDGGWLTKKRDWRIYGARGWYAWISWSFACLDFSVMRCIIPWSGSGRATTRKEKKGRKKGRKEERGGRGRGTRKKNKVRAGSGSRKKKSPGSSSVASKRVEWSSRPSGSSSVSCSSLPNEEKERRMATFYFVRESNCQPVFRVEAK